MTWNLWWTFGENWEARQVEIDRVVTAAAADIYGFQEVFARPHDQFERLRELTGHFGIASTVEPDTSDEAGGDDTRARFGNALLSRYPIVSHRQVRYRRSDGEPGHRSALVAELDHRVCPVTVIVTHLEWRYDRSSQRQDQLTQLFSEIPPPGDDHLIVLCGDLNGTPISDEVRRLTGQAPGFEYASGHRTTAFTDAWPAVRSESGITWTRDNPNSADAQWPNRRLDYVMSSWPRPKPFGNPVTATLVGTEPGPDGVVGSDHTGLVVDLDDRQPFSTIPPATMPATPAS